MALTSEKDFDKIIKGLLKNDRKMQKLLYERYYGLMMKISIRYSEDFEEAKDIVNNGFLKIFTKVENFEGKGSFEGWMKRTMINTALDYLKSKKLETVNIDNINSYDADVFVENESVWSFSESDILKVLQTLPKVSRMVFNLYVIEGYKHKEISEMLNISEGTSHWHLLNARKLLQEKLRNMI